MWLHRANKEADCVMSNTRVYHLICSLTRIVRLHRTFAIASAHFTLALPSFVTNLIDSVNHKHEIGN